MTKIEGFAALCLEQRRLEAKMSGAQSRAWDYLGRPVYESAGQSISRIAFRIREIERAKKALLK